VEVSTHPNKEVLAEVEGHLASLFPFSLYAHPLLYQPEPITHGIFHMHLSDGTPIEIRLTPCPINTGSNVGPILANLIAQKLLSLTELLYSPLFGGCFNPFEEVLQDGERVMPGWRVGV
jgi:hypothetical protein